MLKRFRLRHTADFERLQSEGKRWHHSLAVLIVRPNALGINRFGFTASKRVGRAVDRNYAKRRFREAVRRRLGEVRPGRDCLFIIKPKSRKASSREVDHAVKGLLDQAGLLIGSESEDHVGYV
jgi:ribonuclease P protein component